MTLRLQQIPPFSSIKFFKKIHIRQQSRFSFHMFKTAAGAAVPLGFLEQLPAAAPLGSSWECVGAAP